MHTHGQRFWGWGRHLRETQSCPSCWTEGRGPTERFECPGSPTAVDGSHGLPSTLSLRVVCMCTRVSVCAHMCAWVWAHGDAQLMEGREALSKSEWQGWGVHLTWVCGRTSSRGALTAPANVQSESGWRRSRNMAGKIEPLASSCWGYRWGKQWQFCEPKERIK